MTRESGPCYHRVCHRITMRSNLPQSARPWDRRFVVHSILLMLGGLALALLLSPDYRAASLLAGDDQDPQILAQVIERANFHRKAAGLEPVTHDPALSRGCLAHARYLVKNQGHPSLAGLGVHDEKPDLPGYSPEGRKAAKASVILEGPTLAGCVDAWV